MKTHKWSDLKKTIPAERRARIDKEVQAELLKISLREMREMAGETQQDVAEKLDKTQSELSRLERRDDWLLSTLKDYVKALGGELEVVAVIGDKRLRLRGV